MKSKVFTTSSGVELRIVPVSDVTLAPVYKKMEPRRPKPPVEIVDGLEFKNEAHPGYLAALTAFHNDYNLFAMAAYIELGVYMTLDAEQQEYARWLQSKFELMNPGAPENHFLTYLHITSLCPDMDEITRLFQAIRDINNPTAEQVQEQLETFRSGVPGPEGDGDQDAAERDRVAIGVN